MKKQQEESYLEQLNRLHSRNCTNPLKKFCKDFLADYTRSDLQNFARACIQEDKIETFLQNPTLQIIPDELEAEELAKQFVAYFRLPKFPTLKNLLKLAKSMNIEQIEGLPLPRSIRGFHEEWEGTYSIKYKKDDWIGAIEHTILHEIREIMENMFEELLSGHERLSRRALESEANLFAACVLMPGEQFLSDVYELGFDPIRLQKKYRRAYSSILIRMMKVVSGRLPFIGVLYEKNGSETNGALLNVTYFVKTPNIKTNRKHGRLLWCYIPREGSNVVNSSIAYSVIKYGQSIYREKATGFDFFGYDDFSFIARPVYRKGGHITKIAVIGVPYEHRTVLKVQLDKIDPLFLPECFQMI